LIYIDNIGV